jgi:hypothetical protein
MMTCSRNLSKHLKICYQTKTSREMSHHDFNFFANLMTFLSKEKKWSNILVSYLFFTFMQNFQIKRRRLDMICVFECFQSRCHIWKELHEFLHMMGAIIIFGENIFIQGFKNSWIPGFKKISSRTNSSAWTLRSRLQDLDSQAMKLKHSQSENGHCVTTQNYAQIKPRLVVHGCSCSWPPVQRIACWKTFGK